MSLDFMKLINFRGRLVSTLLGFMVSICTSCTVSGTCPNVNTGLPAHWELSSRPVEVRISASLEQECLDNVLAGLDFWYNKGVTYLSPMMTNDSVLGYGIIVSSSEPWNPYPAVGEAKAGASKGLMFSSEIRFRNCDFWVVVHELGHALGLAHVPANESGHGNIMYPTTEYFGENVSEKQMEQIR